MSKVSLCQTTDRVSGVRSAVSAYLDGANPVRGQRVLLKPNLNTADTPPGSSHDDTIATLIDMLWEMGASGITLGDRGYAPTRATLEQKGLFELCAKKDVQVLVFDELPADQWVLIKEPGHHWPQGFMAARPVVEAECLVLACCLKTHQYGGVFTMSLKLAVGVAPGGPPYMSQLHSSPHQRRMIAELNSAFTPDLVVLDAMEAFVDGGPFVGKMAAGNAVLAAKDRVALDAAGLALLKKLGSNRAVMDTPIWGQEQIARAVELGIGAAGPGEVDIIPADEPSTTLALELKAIVDQG